MAVINFELYAYDLVDKIGDIFSKYNLEHCTEVTNQTTKYGRYEEYHVFHTDYSGIPLCRVTWSEEWVRLSTLDPFNGAELMLALVGNAEPELEDFEAFLSVDGVTIEDILGVDVDEKASYYEGKSLDGFVDLDYDGSLALSIIEMEEAKKKMDFFIDSKITNGVLDNAHELVDNLKEKDELERLEEEGDDLG